MKLYWDFQEKISKYRWQEVYNTGGKGQNKSGFGFTPIELSKYPKSDFRGRLSPDITIFELRVSQKIRVHGFRDKAVLYICWLDKDHDLIT